jgi:hypothetical protein
MSDVVEAMPESETRSELVVPDVVRKLERPVSFNDELEDQGDMGVVVNVGLSNRLEDNRDRVTDDELDSKTGVAIVDADMSS